MHGITRIISGGQTGADRAGLDFAIAKEIQHGGWCPKGRRAMDGVISERYFLQETASEGYPVRTRLNVKESDATIICTPMPPGRGSSLTAKFCNEEQRPYIWVTPSGWFEEGDANIRVDARAFIPLLKCYEVKTLNVAGTRQTVGYSLAMRFLEALYAVQ